MSRILAVAPVTPPHRYEQGDLTAMFAGLVGLAPERRDLLDRLHASCGVRQRHLALPIEDYKGLDGFGDSNDAFIEVGVDLGEQAVAGALDQAGLTARDVDLVLATSVTGIAAPSLDARLVPRLGLRPDVKRIPVFGLGCVAGAAGIARVHDYLVGHPREVAVLLSVELCSLTVQRDDDSMANLVGSGLFGDGAAAVVLAGDEVELPPELDARAPRVVATRSRFFADTERVMGWDIGGSGFRIVLSPGVADVVRDHLPDELDDFLRGHGLERRDITRWVAHPGGPRVLEALQESLGLPADALARSWASLAEVGNLSSSSVLHVLAATMADVGGPGGGPGVLMAMGPGFCAELVLLELAGRRRMSSVTWFTVLVAAVAAERLVELVVSGRHLRWARERGGVETGAGHYPFMAAVHTLLLVSCIVEVHVADRPFVPWLGWPMLAVVAATQGLRWWCVRTLGPQWNTRIVVVPDLPLVARGPYRLLRHPNYVAVVVEVAALPLVHTAWVTAIVFSALNAVVLSVRIPAEQRALAM